MYNDSSLSINIIVELNGVRPSVSLTSSTKIKTGNGRWLWL